MADRAWIPALSIASLVGGGFLEAVAFILFLSRFGSPCTFVVCDPNPNPVSLPVTIAFLGVCLIVPGAVGFYVLHDAKTR